MQGGKNKTRRSKKQYGGSPPYFHSNWSNYTLLTLTYPNGNKTLISATSLPINNGGNLTPEQKNEVEKMIKAKLVGSSNAGKFILSFNDSKEAEVTVVPLEVNDAHSQWEFLTNEARQQIFTAHGAYPNLFGINAGSGFSNNADELDVSSKLLQDYKISPVQEIFIDELAELLELNGLDTDLVFIPLRDTYKSTEAQEEKPTDETVDENEINVDEDAEAVSMSDHVCLCDDEECIISLLLNIEIERI